MKQNSLAQRLGPLAGFSAQPRADGDEALRYLCTLAVILYRFSAQPRADGDEAFWNKV